ncbi:signal recognition particle-docking protein FtsY, partial [Escherichia coli]
PVKASEQAVEEQPQAHTEAEAETFAADVVEVTEQVAESEKAQPEAEVVAQPEPVVDETPEPVAIEREELPLPEDVNAEAVSPEEWQAEAETVEIVEAAEEEAAKEEITDEELET